MNKTFTVFSTLTGKVERTGFCSEDDMDAQALTDEAVIEGNFEDDRYYIADPSGANPTPTRKAELATDIDKATLQADGEDSVTISPIPVDATLTIVEPGGAWVEVAHDGSLEYSTSLVGAYHAILDGIPYVRVAIEFEATP